MRAHMTEAVSDSVQKRRAGTGVQVQNFIFVVHDVFFDLYRVTSCLVKSYLPPRNPMVQSSCQISSKYRVPAGKLRLPKRGILH